MPQTRITEGGKLPGRLYSGVETIGVKDHGGPVLPGFRMASFLQKSPYFDAAARHGVRAYDLYNHMLMPGLYTDPIDEYWHLLEHVTVWDVGVERQVEISGPDAAAFMELITPRDISKCEVNECKYVVLTEPDGGIVNDPVLLRLGQNHFWLSLSDWDVLFWARGVAVHSGLDVTVREPDVAPLQLQGPKSKDVMKSLFGPEILELPYYHMAQTKLDGIPMVISRTGWSAEVGYELYLQDSSRAVELWDRLMEAGKPHNIRAIAPSEIRRVEAGILNYASDITLDNNPYEVGLGWLVDLDKKARFLSRDALKRIKAEGVKRKLVGVEIAGDSMGAWIPEFYPVHSNGHQVGHVTSVTYSPRLKKNVGYAMVQTELSKVGTKLEVETPRGRRAVTVVQKPFVDPKKETPKS